MADADSWDADNFEPEEPIKKAAVTLLDKWEGEDEEEDVKDNWDDDEEEEEKKVEEKKPEGKVSEKKKLSEKIKERENRQKQKQEKIKNTIENRKLTPEEEAEERLRVKRLQEAADLELANDAFGVSNDVPVVTSLSGIEALSPSSKDDFTELQKLLKEKISQYEKSQNKSKKKKKGTLLGGGLKAKMKDDLADYGDFDGGYTQDYEDFM
ncbi:hypothetical protein JZ751_020487 [Albula glossodonta]|uniref:Eukaryotic translation initiation factor 3 30 kDa subunit n=1 Tax=Albula glossodonta TaxID=121402 RepID=A0A8T2PHX0_9TELE|nr:hypothetical protein JZ751_020487 [Albula glossodonta]